MRAFAMRLFDKFRRTEGSIINKENRLEYVLRIAATDPTFRPELYERLLSDTLVVLTAEMNKTGESKIYERGAEVDLVSLPDGKIPVFTSTERIYDKGVIREEVQTLQLKGEDLFHLAAGATFVINPYSDHGKYLLPNEIERMLERTPSNGGHEKIVVDRETCVHLSHPAHYPTDIVDVLIQVFEGTPYVTRAWVGWIFNPSSGESPHYIFALDVESDYRIIAHKVGSTATRMLGPQEFVDVIQIDNNGGISDYFLKRSTPFYER
ncbi:MAG: enhanced serine sensitivity protein SseB C-terminal domain-containing protein [Bacteroidetes bacterium]|nr:enhanced serine sensitivity protein SseB C-terminal domain-containing protein [Bacteroidota bacterium]